MRCCAASPCVMQRARADVQAGAPHRWHHLDGGCSPLLCAMRVHGPAQAARCRWIHTGSFTTCADAPSRRVSAALRGDRSLPTSWSCALPTSTRNGQNLVAPHGARAARRRALRAASVHAVSWACAFVFCCACAHFGVSSGLCSGAECGFCDALSCVNAAAAGRVRRGRLHGSS